jgi:hypothetical protein
MGILKTIQVNINAMVIRRNVYAMAYVKKYARKF